MGFFSSITDLHKKVKKLSPSHYAVKKIGGKKADKIYTGIGTAVGDAYTGGWLSKGKDFAYAQAASEQAKKISKAQAKEFQRRKRLAVRGGFGIAPGVLPGQLDDGDSGDKTTLVLVIAAAGILAVYFFARRK